MRSYVSLRTVLAMLGLELCCQPLPPLNNSATSHNTARGRGVVAVCVPKSFFYFYPTLLQRKQLQSIQIDSRHRCACSCRCNSHGFRDDDQALFHISPFQPQPSVGPGSVLVAGSSVLGVSVAVSVLVSVSQQSQQCKFECYSKAHVSVSRVSVTTMMMDCFRSRRCALP